MTFQTRKPGDTRPAQDFKHETAWELNHLYAVDTEQGWDQAELPVSGDSTAIRKLWDR